MIMLALSRIDLYAGKHFVKQRCLLMLHANNMAFTDNLKYEVPRPYIQGVLFEYSDWGWHLHCIRQNKVGWFLLNNLNH